MDFSYLTSKNLYIPFSPPLSLHEKDTHEYVRALATSESIHCVITFSIIYNKPKNYERHLYIYCTKPVLMYFGVITSGLTPGVWLTEGIQFCSSKKYYRIK